MAQQHGTQIKTSAMQYQDQYSLPSYMSQALSDEIEAINAIYGDGSFQVIRTNPHKTQTRLVIPPTEETSPPTTSLAFWIDFPSDYPASPPSVNGADVALEKQRNAQVWRSHLALFSTLQYTFNPGDVCVFDWLETSVPILECLSTDSFQPEHLSTLIPRDHFDPDNWRWPRRSLVDMSTYSQTLTCAICMDENFAFRLIRLPCMHHWCFSCFQAGFDAACDSNDLLTCCTKRISMSLISDVLEENDNEQWKRYRRTLAMQMLDDALFCPYSSCGELMGPFGQLIRASSLLFAKCPGGGNNTLKCVSCEQNVCVKCRSVQHGGLCHTDNEKGLKLYMREFDVRRCPKCGHGIEKNGGCSHMKCQACGADSTWVSTGSMVLW